MRTHLFKLVAFAAVQTALMVLVCSLADPPASTDASLSPRHRLQTSLREQMLRIWLTDPAAVKQARRHGVEDQAVRKMFEAFRAENDGYLSSIIDKDHRLRTAPGRRLILLGGSNLAFGTDSQVLAERYGVSPVNLGIHETLRAGYQLSHTAEHVRPGDLVIFCFEYGTLLCGGGAADPELEKQICEHLPAMKSHFDEAAPAAIEDEDEDDGIAGSLSGWKKYSDGLALAEFAEFARSAAGRFGGRAKRTPFQIWNHGLAADGELRRRFDAEFADVQPLLVAEYDRWIASGDVYRRSGFNRYGDFVGHYGLTSDRDFNRKGPAVLRPAQRAAVEQSIAILNKWIAVYSEQGATVLFAFPSLCGLDGQSFATDLDALVRSRLDAPVLFPIALADTRPAEHYDTGYHLNWQGICRRMEIWTTALDRHLTPQVDTTPAEHIARRDREIRGTVLARQPSTTATH